MAINQLHTVSFIVAIFLSYYNILVDSTFISSLRCFCLCTEKIPQSSQHSSKGLIGFIWQMNTWRIYIFKYTSSQPVSKAQQCGINKNNNAKHKFDKLYNKKKERNWIEPFSTDGVFPDVHADTPLPLQMQAFELSTRASPPKRISNFHSCDHRAVFHFASAHFKRASVWRSVSGSCSYMAASLQYGDLWTCSHALISSTESHLYLMQCHLRACTSDFWPYCLCTEISPDLQINLGLLCNVFLFFWTFGWYSVAPLKLNYHKNFRLFVSLFLKAIIFSNADWIKFKFEVFILELFVLESFYAFCSYYLSPWIQTK